jgi:hypothetical protein
VGKVIFCHHWASPGASLPSKHIWEDEQAWETLSHGPPSPDGLLLGATTVGNTFPRWFLVPQLWEISFSAITGPIWGSLHNQKYRKWLKMLEKCWKNSKKYRKNPMLAGKCRKCEKCVGKLWKIVGKF